MIPFSIGNQGTQLSTDAAGNPQIVQFAGFSQGSSGDSIYLQAGDWTAGTITIGSNPDFGDTPYGCSFVMPYTGIVRNLYVTFGTKQGVNIQEGVTIHPFACLATANADSAVNGLVYTILPDTLTYTDPYVGTGDGTVPKYTIRKGSSTGLNVTIPEGTLVAFVVGWRGDNVTSEQYGYLSIFGGVFME